MYALTLPVNAFQGVFLKLMFLLSILLVGYMSYDLDPQLLNCGLSPTSLIKGGGAGGAYDPDAQRGAKSEMMWIEHGNVSRDTLTGVQWEWGSTGTRRESNQRNWFCLRYENILFSPQIGAWFTRHASLVTSWKRDRARWSRLHAGPRSCQWAS